jgi:hypothetical protein
MTVLSFTLGGVDVTSTIVWWTCAGCAVEVELPAEGAAAFVVPCPDCGDAMDEPWEWEVAVPAEPRGWVSAA